MKKLFKTRELLEDMDGHLALRLSFWLAFNYATNRGS